MLVEPPTLNASWSVISAEQPTFSSARGLLSALGRGLYVHLFFIYQHVSRAMDLISVVSPLLAWLELAGQCRQKLLAMLVQEVATNVGANWPFVRRVLLC